MPELTPEILESLELSEDATSDDVLAAIAGIRETNPAPTPDVNDPAPILTPEFEKQYPEIASQLKADRAEMAEMRAGRRKDAAKMFAAQYERFSTDEGAETGLGFSGLALTQVEEMHLKIADGLMTHDDLSSLLDNVASGNAIVDYRELGSTRGKEVTTDGASAATELTNKAKAIQVETGESYGDALAKVMADPENEELVSAYRSTYRPAHEGGEK